MQALAALSDNVLVSGANDGSVCVWVRCADGRAFRNAFTSLGDHTNMLRAVLALPPCGLCPEGGFATACLDKLVRVFSYSPASHAVACVATLAGHQGGVDSLALTSLGQLVSGGRDGQARVWDLATGAALQVLANHENKVVVCGLAGGAIATGSAGRKNEAGQHVDYKLRLWKCAPGAGGAPPSWSLERTISDHEQAIQDLDAMPGGEGFLSASNDGTVRVRDAAGAPLERISTPPNAEGAPTAVYRARLLPASMWIAGCCEDNSVRLWCTDTLPAPADQLALPGTPWAVVGLSNGDVAVGCTHAASGRVGHVYLFTQDPARAAPEGEAAAFAADCVPPPRSEGAGGGGGGGGGGALQKVHIAGPYDARHATPSGATAVGGYGFFRQADGGIFVCTWTGAGWDDVGVAEGREGDDGVAGGGGGGGGFDFSQVVEMETRSGVAKVPLRWNDGDDLDLVAEAFCKENGVAGSNVGQVRTFMVNTMAQRGLPPGGRRQKEAEAAAAAAAASRPPTLAARLGLTLIPSSIYVDATAVDWKKVRARASSLLCFVCVGVGVARAPWASQCVSTAQPPSPPHTLHTGTAHTHTTSPSSPSPSPGSCCKSCQSSMPAWPALGAWRARQRRRPGCATLPPRWQTRPATTPPGSPPLPLRPCAPRCCPPGPCPTSSQPWTMCAWQ